VVAIKFPYLATINALPKGLLYPHQVDGVAFLISKGRAILGDDMGLGKTRQAIVGMQIAAPTGMILVVCPASLKLNWRREIRMVDPDTKVEVVGIPEGKPADPRWVIVNYDLLASNAEWLHGIPWSGVILDEAHFIKNKSQRTSDCLKLLGVTNNSRSPLIGPRQVYLLTGTPITNRPTSSWAQANSSGVSGMAECSCPATAGSPLRSGACRLSSFCRLCCAGANVSRH
jgi:SNF2 family DNA or RNA helicase